MDSEAYRRLEQRLVALARSTGALRAALAQLSAWLVEREAWKPIGAQNSAPQETCPVGCQLEPDAIRLFRAVLCTVQRRLESTLGRLPTRGEALGAMLDHAMAEWGGDEEKVPRRYQVFARDGWRCVIPGCTSMRNLHDHHIPPSAGSAHRPRSRDGSRTRPAALRAAARGLHI